MSEVERRRDYAGPAILSYGFRPFFLAGALYAAVTVLAWVPVLHGRLALVTAFSPRDWHVHEMLFGFLPAVIAGFLLTAIPNWTGRLPLRGRPLLVLLGVWMIGRLAVTVSAEIGWATAAVLDLAFLVLLAAAAAREILAGRNWNNLKVLGVLGALIVANAVFHLEAHLTGYADVGVRLGIAAVLVLVTLVGGRIVPSFTRNWLARENPGRLPTPFGRFDLVATGGTLVALAAWVAVPAHPVTGLALLGAGALQLVRLARWAGDRTMDAPIVLILHVAYAFVPLGFALIGLAALVPDLLPQSAGIHAWTGGAMGAMTLAVMTRASLGHTGRALVATPATQAAYLLVVGGTLLRIGAALPGAHSGALVGVAAVAWSGAFLVFAIGFGPILTAPRAA